MSNSIKFKHITCKNQYGERTEIKENVIALYIVLTHKCNAHCEFCEYNQGEVNLDIKKFTQTIHKLSDICNISTVHFTGGEPTVEIDKLKQLLKIVKTQDKIITTSVNTNGYNLKLLENLEDLDNIALSRHTITDKNNQKIFGCTNVPLIEDIERFKDKQKLHLSCNLIRGFIDSDDKIIQYLEFASRLGINDIGFVSLMQINEYCKEHYIEFSDKLTECTDRIIRSRCFENDESGQVTCKCENYLYRAQNHSLVSAYHRYAIRNNEIADYLVYENNKLKQGFNGDTIEL